jgi:predicted RNA methylase
VIKELSLKGTEKIADIGADSGYFTFLLSKKLSTGKVYAIDIEPKMIRHIHYKAVLHKIQNIEAFFSTTEVIRIVFVKHEDVTTLLIPTGLTIQDISTAYVVYQAFGKKRKKPKYIKCSKRSSKVFFSASFITCYQILQSYAIYLNLAFWTCAIH